MKRSTDRILTTHTGSLPRPNDLVPVLYARDRGEPFDEESFVKRVREATTSVVAEQLRCGLDIVNDGEMGKVAYSTYVKDRLTGFEGETSPLKLADLEEYPQFAERNRGRVAMARPACSGPIAYRGLDQVRRDIENLSVAFEGREDAEAFLTAASPGVVSLFLGDQYYGSHERYVFALADALKAEYDAIHASGFLLQLDCPDLAAGRHSQFSELSLDGFRKIVELHLEALNHAVRDIPADRLRLHLCWGNYEGPHHHDVPLRDIIDVVLRARPSAISFEAANPRHAHEWSVFREIELPADKILMPGVLDSTTNYIEHPELVAERIRRFADAVGKENVIASSDCGFATFAGTMSVDPAIAWAKLRSMVEGARLASESLFR